jgi:hypothetical protein
MKLKETGLEGSSEKTQYEEYLRTIKYNYWTGSEPKLELSMVNIQESVFESLLSDIKKILVHLKNEDKSYLKRKLISGGSWELTDFKNVSDDMDILKISSKVNTLINKYNENHFYRIGIALRQLNGRLYFTCFI